MAATVLAVTLALPVLSACSTVRPLYGEATTRYLFSYAAPASRLDQIIYSELRLKLGPQSDSPDAYQVAVSTTPGYRGLTKSNVARPFSTSEASVTASVSVTAPDGTLVFSGTRFQTAIYTGAGQALADSTAASEASDRAARSLADTIRLLIVGALEAKSHE
jgi:hypothetical protein